MRRWRPIRHLRCCTRRDTILPWELSSKTRIFLAELLSFVERVCQSEPSSTIWKAERHSKTFCRDFPPCRVKPLSLLSKKQNTCFSRVPKCTPDRRMHRRAIPQFADRSRLPNSPLRRIGRLKNGDLLKAAEAAKFDVFLTVDQGIEYQQNLTGRKIAIIVFRTKSNRLHNLLQLVPACLARIESFIPDRS